VSLAASKNVPYSATDKKHFKATVPDFIDDFQIGWSGRNATSEELLELLGFLGARA
jgi:hypothetical protein